MQAVGRTATTDHVIDGVTIRAGEPALVVLAAANRDPAVFDQPDEFHPTAPAPHRWPSATARTTASAPHWPASRSPPRCNAPWPVDPACGHPTWRDTPAIRGPLTVPTVFAN